MSTENQSAQDTSVPEESSLNDDLREAFAQLEETPEEPEAAEEASEEAEEPEAAEEQEEGEEPETDEAEEEAEVEEVELDPELKSTFNYLKKEDKEYLESEEVTPQMREIFLRRMKEQNTTFHEKTKSHSDLVKVIEPYADSLARAGMTPAQKVGQYIAIEQHLLTNPQEAIRQLAQSYGVDLSETLAPEQSDDEDDPALRKVSDIEKRLNEREKAEQQQQREFYAKQVSDFEQAKDANGEFKYPLFQKQTFKAAMSAKFENGEATSLEQAYQQVLEDLGLDTKPPTPARKKTVKQAKKAATSVSSKTSAQNVTTAEDESIGDTLRKQFKANGFS